LSCLGCAGEFAISLHGRTQLCLDTPTNPASSQRFEEVDGIESLSRRQNAGLRLVGNQSLDALRGYNRSSTVGIGALDHAAQGPTVGRTSINCDREPLAETGFLRRPRRELTDRLRRDGRREALGERGFNDAYDTTYPHMSWNRDNFWQGEFHDRRLLAVIGKRHHGSPEGQAAAPRLHLRRTLVGMDLLTDVISAIRTGQAHSRRVEHLAPFGLRFPATESAGFHVVLQGHCWSLSPSGEPALLHAGDVAFLPGGSSHGLADSPTTPVVEVPSLPPIKAKTEHSRISGSGSRGSPTTVMLCGAYLLDRTRPHPLLSDLPDILCLPARIGSGAELRAVIDLLGAELERERPGSDAAISVLVDLLLLYILRAWIGESTLNNNRAGWAAALNDPAMIAALRCIHEEPERRWSVRELGAAAGMSRSAFSKRFSSLLGQPPMTYLTWWRMTAAARLLHRSEATIADIADQLGYTSEFAFAHAFKREFGLSPGVYRREFRLRARCGTIHHESANGPSEPR
jgi:AraC-like DNA-binding protein